jgi:hypothetical protein
MSYYTFTEQEYREQAQATLWTQHYDSDSAPLYDDAGHPIEDSKGDRDASLAGYYWCCCIPGCMPDSDWNGPFETEALAVSDGRTNGGEGDFDEDEIDAEESGDDLATELLQDQRQDLGSL